MNMLVCKICNQELNFITLSKHIIHKHNLSREEYYSTYIGQKITCHECGKETKFLDFTRGYQKFCSLKCSNNNKERKEKFTKAYSLNNIEEVNSKRRKTNLERYGNEIANKNELIKEKTLKTFRQNQIQKFMTYLDKFDLEIIDGEYKNYNSIITFKCKKCGLIFKESPFNVGQRMYKCSCGRPYSKSTNEIELLQFINEILPNEKIIRNLKINNYELDIIIPSKNIAIEYNGLYWHSELILRDPVNYHSFKLQLCLNNNLRLIQVFEDEWLDNQEIVKERIYHIMQLSNSKEKIYARKCSIQIIDSNLKNDFLQKYHLQGKDISSVNIGAFYNNNLISVMTFSKGNISKGSKTKEGTWELSRFCSDYHCNIVGIAGKLLSYFEKNYEWEKIFSYADRRWSDGNLYYKLGFKLDYITKPNYWYTKDGLRRIHRFNLRKKSDEPKEIPEWVLRKSQGFYRIWDAGNFRFSMQKT